MLGCKKERLFVVEKVVTGRKLFYARNVCIDKEKLCKKSGYMRTSMCINGSKWCMHDSILFTRETKRVGAAEKISLILCKYGYHSHDHICSIWSCLMTHSCLLFGENREKVKLESIMLCLCRYVI